MTFLRMAAGACLLLVGASSAGGCYTGPDFHDETPSATDRPSAGSSRAPTGSTGGSTSNGGYGSTVTTVGVANLHGSMGHVANFASTQGQLHVTASPTLATVQTDAVDTSQHWWAMTRLTINGGLDHPDLHPGAQVVFDPQHPVSPGGLDVMVVGCSGPRQGDYTYDAHATGVVLNVKPGSSPDTRAIAYTAYFDGPTGRQTVEGEFEYSPR